MNQQWNPTCGFNVIDKALRTRNKRHLMSVSVRWIIKRQKITKWSTFLQPTHCRSVEWEQVVRERTMDITALKPSRTSALCYGRNTGWTSFTRKKAPLFFCAFGSWIFDAVVVVCRMRYPPYSDFKTNGLTFLMRYRRPLPAWLNKLVIFGLGLATGYAARVITSRIFRITLIGKLLYRLFKFLVPGQPTHSLTAPAGPQ